MPSIARKKPSFPNTEPWDDFLDFSRWRVPARSVIPRRVLENSVLFSGNYLRTWGFVAVVYGLFANRRILGSFFVVAVAWRAVEALYCNTLNAEARDGPLGGSKRLQEDSPSHAPKRLGLLLAVFVLYEFGVVFDVFLAVVGTLLIAVSHALFRPVINEVYFLRQAKAEAEKKRLSVVYEDQTGEDDSQCEGENELTFTEVDMSDQNGTTLRNRMERMCSDGK